MIPAWFAVIGAKIGGLFGMITGAVLGFIWPGVLVGVPVWAYRRRPVYGDREEYGWHVTGPMVAGCAEQYTGVLHTLSVYWHSREFEVLDVKGMAEIGAVESGTLTRATRSGLHIRRMLDNAPVPRRTAGQVLRGQPPIRKVPIPRTVAQTVGLVPARLAA